MMREDNYFVWHFFLLKFIYSEKATKIQKVSKANHGVLNLPKNERLDNFHYINLSQPSVVWRIEDTINCFRDLLTFIQDKSKVDISKKNYRLLRIYELYQEMLQFEDFYP